MNFTAHQKHNARTKLNRALKLGSVLRPIGCQGCGIFAELEAHHHDYSKPLDVVWLCLSCHGAAHRKTRCAHGHEMTEKNLYIWPNGNRACRECRTQAVRNHRARRNEISRTEQIAGPDRASVRAAKALVGSSNE